MEEQLISAAIVLASEATFNEIGADLTEEPVRGQIRAALLETFCKAVLARLCVSGGRRAIRPQTFATALEYIDAVIACEPQLAEAAALALHECRRDVTNEIAAKISSAITARII